MNTCPNCGWRSPDPAERKCDDCGGSHRLMEICPERRGYLALLVAWFRGEYTMMPGVAIFGTCLGIVVAYLAIRYGFS